ncbi:hypothetical protein SANTM175S_03949 [Streptomyces antimycoticus]
MLRVGTGSNGVYVTPHNAAGAAIDRVDIRLRDGADRAAVEARLREAGRATGTQVLTKDAWASENYPRSSENTRLGLLMILGIALVYTGIALANTLVMATSDRVRDLAVLRLTGATKPQVLRLVAVEALVVVAVGSVLGAAVPGLNLLASGVHWGCSPSGHRWSCPGRPSVRWRPRVPCWPRWPPSCRRSWHCARGRSSWRGCVSDTPPAPPLAPWPHPLPATTQRRSSSCDE